MSDGVDTVVIGAGVVGLAIARELALRGAEVVVLETASAIGTGISARNSEVIHAGIYYPPGSLKARLCVLGKRRLYEYAESHGVPHKRLGKLIVATNESEIPKLETLKDTAAQNGVSDLEWLDRKQVAAIEPDLECTAALLSPSTGIIDVHALMLAYQGDGEDNGTMIAFNCPVIAIHADEAGFTVETGGAAAASLRCRQVVNAAGLGAWAVAGAIKGLDGATIPPRYMAKGNYFTLSGHAPFSHLVYPAPEAAGLGVHLTLDMGGQAKFGPDVEWIEHEDYTVDPARAETFERAIRTYWPGLPAGALQAGYAGIRPKLQAPGEMAHDFAIHGAETHGIKGLINLYGIESPGITSSLAISEHVADHLAQNPCA